MAHVNCSELGSCLVVFCANRPEAAVGSLPPGDRRRRPCAVHAGRRAGMCARAAVSGDFAPDEPLCCHYEIRRALFLGCRVTAPDARRTAPPGRHKRSPGALQTLTPVWPSMSRGARDIAPRMFAYRAYPSRDHSWTGPLMRARCPARPAFWHVGGAGSGSSISFSPGSDCRDACRFAMICALQGILPPLPLFARGAWQ